MSSKNNEGNGYRQDLDLLVILHLLHNYILQEVVGEKSVLLRPSYRMWDGLADIKRKPWLCGLADYFILFQFILC
jgi:hypothetical protein